MTLWDVFLCGWVASEILILMVTRTRRGGGIVSDRGSLLILWAVICASLSLGGWIAATQPHTISGSARLQMASLWLLVAGLAIRWMAIVTLGKSFSANVAIRANQTIHKTGLFRMVRHPSYSGLLITLAAIGLRTQNWLGMAAVVLPTTASLLYRIHVEEAALGEAFGAEYTDYSRVTKRLVPGIY